MDALLQYLDSEGMDASEFDEAVGDYMIQLASEGGTFEEVWSVMEGCYPELEEVRAGYSNGHYFQIISVHRRRIMPAIM